jgi:hypothetical protein
VSHNSVSEAQALKDANRDVLWVNGVVQAPGTAHVILATLVSMVRALWRGSGRWYTV